MNNTLNKEGLNKPNKKIKDFPNDNQVTDSSERRGIREKLEYYSDVRMVSGRISETHSRQTYFVDDDIAKQLDNLVEYFEATNGLESKFNDNQTLKQTRENRLLAKGIKSKLVNMAIEQVLDQWSQEEGLIVDVDRIRYKNPSDNTYHRTFKFTENGVTYLMTQSNRGHELEYMDTTTHSLDEIEQRFQSYVERAKSQSKK